METVFRASSAYHSLPLDLISDEDRFVSCTVSLKERRPLSSVYRWITSTLSSLIGQTVTVTGWVARRRDHGGVAFVDLRDRSGFAQIVVRDEADFDPLRNEWVLKVTGTVERRPEGNENPNLPSGEVELIVDELTVLNRAAALPFQVDEHVEVGEETRLRHRYLDLRRPSMHRAARSDPVG